MILENKKMALDNIEKNMRSHAYAIAGYFDKAKELDTTAAKEMLQGIINYLKEQKNIK